MYEVVYLVNESGEKIHKIFRSYYEFWVWWNAARHSKHITLLRYPMV